MNYLVLIARLASVLNSTKLKGDKAAYFACRSLCEQLESRNPPSLWQDIGYSKPVTETYEP